MSSLDSPRVRHAIGLLLLGACLVAALAAIRILRPPDAGGAAPAELSMKAALTPAAPIVADPSADISSVLDAAAAHTDAQGNAAVAVPGPVPSPPANTPASVLALARSDCEKFVSLVQARGISMTLVSVRVVDRFVMVQQSVYATLCAVASGAGPRLDEVGTLTYDQVAPSDELVASVGSGAQMNDLPSIVRTRSAEVCANFVTLANRDTDFLRIRGVQMTLLSWRVAGRYRQLSLDGYFLGCRVSIPGLGEREMGYVTKYDRDGDLSQVIPDPY